MRASNLPAAAAALAAAPAARDALVATARKLVARVDALGEAFEFVIGDVERKGVVRLRLRERAENQDDLQVRDSVRVAGFVLGMACALTCASGTPVPVLLSAAQLPLGRGCQVCRGRMPKPEQPHDSAWNTAWVPGQGDLLLL